MGEAPSQRGTKTATCMVEASWAPLHPMLPLPSSMAGEGGMLLGSSGGGINAADDPVY